jgi:hypothetical protein
MHTHSHAAAHSMHAKRHKSTLIDCSVEKTTRIEQVHLLELTYKKRKRENAKKFFCRRAESPLPGVGLAGIIDIQIVLSITLFFNYNFKM